ncbi:MULTISPECIES: hypothetical protein [Parachlamydia]|jgi:hypothetical protein|uniref:Uncharacterized protein n=2 Tax=Parachlamydia acanthamoebae TaxID=83552 RepID=F8KZZ0_PARAV|nr:hypothetical protein [Parachlamydia acanthamoebae]EFB40977.1 hypothetical protein pah_c173o028 [Parachlamydia acanthamoebae str. Hall's coccus]KIA77797.1 hypothetical protein DB43_FS00380 [Parachlamydia acanthamoebae]CCB86499.1 putative uncharacterized protein [Parachlamydia acanthamoebae UV-7]
MRSVEISNGRAYIISSNYDIPFYHENGDPNKLVLKGASFKIHTGLMAKAMSLFGFALKFQAIVNGERQVIFVNKQSFAKHVVRSYIVHASKEFSIGMMPKGQYVRSLAENYSIPMSKMINMIEIFVLKNFSTYKKSRGAFKDLTVFYEGMIKICLEKDKNESPKD